MSSTTTKFPENQEAAREVRRRLADVVRNDWDWPLPSDYSAADGFVGLVSGPAESYRERYYGTSDSASASSSSSEEEGRNGGGYAPRVRRSGTTRGAEDMFTFGAGSASSIVGAGVGKREGGYKFESPETVGGKVDAKQARKKRKRLRTLEEEIGWNEGVECFVRRRNVWTGAVSRADASTSQLKGQAAALRDGDDGEAADAAASQEKDEEKQQAVDLDTASSLSVSKTSDSAPTLPLLDPLLPVSLPLIPENNALRANITTRSYPDIYDKCVLQTRTPSVPINLRDMTRALVQGWKESGEWPPRMTGPEPSITKRSRKAGGGASSPEVVRGRGPNGWGTTELVAAKKTARNGHGEGNGHGHDGANGVVVEGSRSSADFGGSTSLLANHPHVKKGVDSMKRVFRLSSGSPKAALTSPTSPTSGEGKGADSGIGMGGVG
ncbi:hypothetical protein LTS18_015001 [Coniosporium uncinatum]|uniref:Uncharacterized protein n=1 Tax=Coniosporium uncinatum TaxID=93489 RepID=A0ACC3D8G3_9PEZI|nr:hypothetical protein LTS18_015001 [Coniosporium uncinatum]